VSNSNNPQLYGYFPSSLVYIDTYTEDDSTPLLAVNNLVLDFNTIPSPSNWDWSYIVGNGFQEGAFVGAVEIEAGTSHTLVGNINLDDFGLDNVVGLVYRLWLPIWEAAYVDAIFESGAGFYITYDC
jgi:hypothetical protein